MRRRLLIALTSVGSIIVGLGGVGLFAALTDTATSETNRVNTAAQPRALDLLIAPRTQVDGIWTCGEFTDGDCQVIGVSDLK